MSLSDDRVYEVIALHGAGALTIPQIALLAKCGTATVWRSVKRLEKSKRIERSTHGRNGTKYKLYALD